MINGDTKINMCDNCVWCFATCESKNVKFGNGTGNDNVIKCDSFNTGGTELEANEWIKGLKI